MTQFLRDEASDSEEVLTPLMLDGTYLSRNFATLGPFLTLQPPCVGYECPYTPTSRTHYPRIHAPEYTKRGYVRGCVYVGVYGRGEGIGGKG